MNSMDSVIGGVLSNVTLELCQCITRVVPHNVIVCVSEYCCGFRFILVCMCILHNVNILHGHKSVYYVLIMLVYIQYAPFHWPCTNLVMMLSSSIFL